VESNWRTNVTRWSLDLLYYSGGYHYCALAAEMLDFPGKIICSYRHVGSTPQGVIMLDPGTGFYEFFAFWSDPFGRNFPYGFRVPPDHP